MSGSTASTAKQGDNADHHQDDANGDKYLRNQGFLGVRIEEVKGTEDQYKHDAAAEQDGSLPGSHSATVAQ